MVHPKGHTYYKEHYEKHNLLTTHDYHQWLKADGEHNTIINLPGLPPAAMVKFCEAAYPRYYLRPAYLWLKFKQLINQPEEGFRSLRSGFNYLKVRLSV
jgi:hypothetical protein